MLSKLGRGLAAAAAAAAPSVRVSEEVRAAVASGAAVVALESTIFTSGMPRPTNVDTALEVERIVRSRGAVPATVGLLRGRLVVGLSQSEIAALGEDNSAVKCSTRDLPTALARRLNGGTTVSATLVAARLAGLPLFVTGGVGGVHRQGELSMDVSADLAQLGRTPIMTVCAGVKAFLDVGRTLEALETHGVGVATLLLVAEEDEEEAEADFPAFYTPSSGHKSPCTLRSVSQCARVLAHVAALDSSGFLLAVPIPREFRQLGDAIDASIREALIEAERLGVRGKAVTPFLLDRVNRLTGGESLRANIALVRQNADVGARIAKEFSDLLLAASASDGGDSEGSRKNEQRSTNTAAARPLSIGSFATANGERSRAAEGAKHQALHREEEPARAQDARRPVVIGGCNLDLTARLAADAASIREGEGEEAGENFPSERTHPGRLVITCGGVGRNIADALARCGHRPVLLSALGRDHTAELHRRLCPHVDWSAVRQLPDDSGCQSAAYALALRADGSLLFGVADMAAHEAIDGPYLDANEAAFASAGVVCCDANCPAETVLLARRLARRHGAEFWFEPTDTDKAAKIFADQSEAAPLCDWTTPNALELAAMYRLAGGSEVKADGAGGLDVSQALAMCRHLIASGVAASVAVKLGSRGLLVVPGNGDPWGRALHCTAVPCQQIVSVSGAGDSLVGGLLAARLSGEDLAGAAVFATLCAHASLLDYEAVSPRLISVANSDSLRRCVTVTYVD